MRAKIQEYKAVEEAAMKLELSGIRKALDLYVEAAVKGNSEVALPAFAKTATMSHAENGKLISVPIQALFDYYDHTGPHPAFYEITACHVSTDVAVVCIDSKFGESRFDDMFTLVRTVTTGKSSAKFITRNDCYGSVRVQPCLTTKNITAVLLLALVQKYYKRQRVTKAPWPPS